MEIRVALQSADWRFDPGYVHVNVSLGRTRSECRTDGGVEGLYTNCHQLMNAGIIIFGGSAFAISVMSDVNLDAAVLRCFSPFFDSSHSIPQPA